MMDVEFKLTPKQKRIIDGLMAIDDDMANIYKGAYKTLADSNNPDRFSQCAHSLREVTSLLSRVKSVPQDRIEPDCESEEKGDEEDRMVVKLKKRFALEEGYTLPIVQPEIDSALQQWNKAQRFLCAVAHHGKRVHRNLAEVDFLKRIDEFEDILDYFLRPSPLTLNELDKFISMETPTDRGSDELLKIIATSPIYVEYFFKNVNTEGWLPILRGKGIFQTPQGSITKDKGILFPAWWPSTYLTKMAKTHPEDVIDIILEMDATDNIRVHTDLIEASLEMDAANACKIVPLVIEWIKTRYPSIVVMRARELCAKLILDGREASAFKLLSGLLSIGNCKHKRDESRYSINDQNDWELEQIADKLLPHFLNRCPIPTITLLCTTLNSCLVAEGQTESNHDYSHIWRPAIEDHEYNSPKDDFENILITAIRDCLSFIGKENPTILQQAIGILDGYSALIFKRLQINAMRQYPVLLEGEINSTVINPQLLNSLEYWHEMHHLLKEIFPTLPSQVKEAYCSSVRKGMEREKILVKYRRLSEDVTVEEMVENVQSLYRLRLLTPIREYLSPEFEPVLVDLEKKYGHLDQPDFLNGYVKVTEWSSEAAKKFVGLQDLSNEEIISLFRGEKNAKFPDDFGLEDAFESMVASNPGRFLEMDVELRSMPISFVVHVLEGLREAQKNRTSVNWPRALLFLDTLISHSWNESHPQREAFYSNDSVIYHSINLIEEFFSANSNAELKEDVWKILVIILDKCIFEPDEINEMVGGDDPLTHALNDLDGKSMGLLLDFISWSSRVNRSKTEMDVDAQNAMEKILDVTLGNPSPVRTMVGMRFPFLFFQYQEWTKKNIEKIFPDVRSYRKAWKLTWEGYILANKVHRDVYTDLRSQYTIAINRIDGCSEESRLKIINHLVISYIHGLEEFDDSLLKYLSSKTNPVVRGLIVRNLGYSLNVNLEKNGPDIISEIADRCRRYWDWRLQMIKPSGGSAKTALSEEFKEVNVLFASLPGKKSEDIYRLDRTMELTGGIVDRPQQIFERLIEYVGVDNDIMVSMMQKILVADRTTWERELYREELFRLLNALCSNTDTELRDRIGIIVNIAVQQGFFEFRRFSV